MEFILWDNGREHGPYGVAKVQNAIHQGKISPKVLARLSSGKEWKPLEMLLPKATASTQLPPSPSVPPETTGLPTRKAVNGKARMLGTGLILLSVVALAAGGLKSIPQSMEELHFRKADEQEVRSLEAEALGSFANASGLRSQAREIGRIADGGRERADEHRAQGEELRERREQTMYLFLGLGTFLLVAGAAIRVFS